MIDIHTLSVINIILLLKITLLGVEVKDSFLALVHKSICGLNLQDADTTNSQDNLTWGLFSFKVDKTVKIEFYLPEAKIFLMDKHLPSSLKKFNLFTYHALIIPS